MRCSGEPDHSSVAVTFWVFSLWGGALDEATDETDTRDPPAQARAGAAQPGGRQGLWRRGRDGVGVRVAGPAGGAFLAAAAGAGRHGSGGAVVSSARARPAAGRAGPGLGPSGAEESRRHALPAVGGGPTDPSRRGPLTPILPALPALLPEAQALDAA